MTTVLQDRWKKLEGISLKSGAHSPDSTFCVMEAVAFVAGEKWTDNPKCACPIISAFLRSWNDALPNDGERDRLLKPLIPKIVGTKNEALEKKRATMCADWYIRVHLPAWLRLAGLNEQADRVESLPEIISFSKIPSIQGTLEAVRNDALAARLAARSAARSAAESAARSAAESAARSAAWSAAESAARSAAESAAWSAAESAARSAAESAAWSAYSPTVKKLQDSALELIERMIAA